MAYGFLIAQTAHQGCCYADFGATAIEEISESLIGLDARNIAYRTLFQRIALLDAIYGSLCGPGSLSLTLPGLPQRRPHDGHH